jgi:hypothetical protein
MKKPETRIGCDRKGCKLPFTPKSRFNKFHPVCNTLVSKATASKAYRQTHKNTKDYKPSEILSPIGIKRQYIDMERQFFEGVECCGIARRSRHFNLD